MKYEVRMFVFLVLLFSFGSAIAKPPRWRRPGLKMYPNICFFHLKDHPKTAKIFEELSDYKYFFRHDDIDWEDSECCVCPDCHSVTDLTSLTAEDRFFYLCNHCNEWSRKFRWDKCEYPTLNSGYFQECNRKTLKHLKIYLNYLDDCKYCNCYWPEWNQIPYDIKMKEMKHLENLCWFLPDDYSPYWTKDTYKGKSLVTNLFFYSQYYKVTIDMLANAERHVLQNGDHNKLAMWSTELNTAYEFLDENKEDFKKIYKVCLKQHAHEKILYEMGMIYMHSGRYDKAFNYISKLIELANEKGTCLDSEMYQQEAIVYSELGMYDEAIEALNTLLRRNPDNKEAYLQRAVAYFEIGDFEFAVEDYVKYNNPGWPVGSPPSKEFLDAFTKAVVSSSKESLKNFVPSLCNSIYGMGSTLWAFGQHPVESVKEVAAVSYELGNEIYKFLKNVDKEYLDQCDEQINNFFVDFEKFDDYEKGKRLGNLIGTYGTDFIVGLCTTKGAHYVTKLKRANQACNLETYANSSITGKKAVKAAATELNMKRTNFFKNATIHWDKQNKHIPGSHNYKHGKSVITISKEELSILIDKHKGSGHFIKNNPMQPDFRERVDFGRVIGIHKTKQGVEQSTTIGMIVYDKKGCCHVVPLRKK